MKNYILTFIVLFSFFNNLFSQENRSNREWSDENQTTYYMDPENNEYRSDWYPNSRVNNPDNNSWNDAVEHRTKAIWSDNSTIVSDEKTGMHSYIPYTYVSEDDILWAKRLKKLVDLRITQNHSLYFPVEVRYDNTNASGGGASINEIVNGMDARKNLFQILKDAATTINPQTGEPLVGVYNESLTRKYTMQEIFGNSERPGVFQWLNLVPLEDEFGDVYGDTTLLEEFGPIDIAGYFIEEEVFFDKRRSKLDYRFVSITPVVRDPNSGSSTMFEGADLAIKPLGTFYFPEVRHLLANHKVFPVNGNLAQRMSFDEFFHRKLFASNILKETNVYDRQIATYLPGRSLERLLEGERIKDQIRLYESDMWNY